MSEALRADLARELGVYDRVQREGWGAVPARDCGRLVQQAVLRAEAMLAARHLAGFPPMQATQAIPRDEPAGWSAGPGGGRR